MADNRALMAAFQKVRADVDQALEQTRRKEEAARAAEEAKRAQERREKRQGRAPGQPAGERREALQPSSRIKLLRAKRIAQGKAKASSQWLKLLG